MTYPDDGPVDLAHRIVGDLEGLRYALLGARDIDRTAELRVALQVIRRIAAGLDDDLRRLENERDSPRPAPPIDLRTRRALGVEPPPEPPARA